MTDMERDQPDEAADDATEDLEITDEDADEVRGGTINKWSTDAPGEGFK